MFHVHIDIFKKFKCFMLKSLVITLYCNFGMENNLYRSSINNSLPEDEPSGSEHVKDVIN